MSESIRKAPLRKVESWTVARFVLECGHVARRWWIQHASESPHGFLFHCKQCRADGKRA